MEDKYFEAIKKLNEAMRKSNPLASVLPRKGFVEVKKALSIVDKQLINTFKGGSVSLTDDEARTVVRVVDILLEISADKPLNDASKYVMTLILHVMSLWNMSVYKNNRIETRLAASMRLLQSHATIGDLLEVSRRLVARMRMLDQVTPAFDVARHYAEAQEKAVEVKDECDDRGGR